MLFIIYVLIAFIVFFVCRKKLYPIAVEKASKGGYYSETPDYLEFWLTGIIPILWIVSVPLYFLWIILEKIYNKFNKQ